MKFKSTLVGVGAILLFLSCSTNPFTGKKTIALVPNSQLFPTAFAQYNQVLAESNVETGTARSEMIVRVGQRIAIAAERWLNANNHQGYLNDYEWEASLVDSKKSFRYFGIIRSITKRRSKAV